MTLRRRMFLSSLAGSAYWLAGWPLRAAGASGTRVRVDIERAQAQVGEPIQYTVEVTHEGMGQIPQPMLRDELGDSFDIRGPTISSSFRSAFTNGQVTRQAILTHSYVLIPLRPGQFRLGAFASDASGNKIASNDLVLEVVGEAAAPREEAAVAGKPSQAAGPVFLWAAVDKTTAYVGEQITYVLDVYERTRFVNIQLRTLPSFPDFWAEELPDGVKTTATVGGMTYRVHPGLRRALFPQRAGTLRIGAAEVTVGLRSVVTGDPVQLEVLPLPAKGQPANFSANNVGRFTIKADVDRAQVRQGEPLTLAVTIEGVGNVRGIDPGEWPELPGMRRYDPKVDVTVDFNRNDLEGQAGPAVGGQRVYEFLLIPNQAGRLTIPPHAFSFFDPAREAYQTVRTDPIVIEVQPSAEPSAQKDAGETTASDQQEAGVLASIVGGDSLPRMEPRKPWLTRGRWLAGMATVPGGLALWALGTVAWRRLTADEQARARAEARARRRSLIQSARSSVDDGAGFHTAVAQLLHEAAVARAGNAGVGLPRPELLSLLARRGVDNGDLGRLRELLDLCDEARFGAATGTADSRDSILERALALVQHSTLARGRS